MVVEIEGRLIVPERRQVRLLLAYMLANRSSRLRRDELEAVLWESDRPANPKSALSAALSHLRHDLGPLAHEVLPPREISLKLPEDTWIDVEETTARAQQALQAQKEGQPAKAVKLADHALLLLDRKFLPEFEATWIDEKRRELDEWALSVRRTSVEARLQLGEPELEEAERIARELVERSPYRESSYMLQMEVLEARGDAAEANLVYDRLRRLLLDELGKTPDPAITEFNARLLGIAPEAAPTAGGGSVPEMPKGPAAAQLPLPPRLESFRHQGFVGRDEAMARLWLRWQRVSIKPRVAVLSGEPGIGKTRLAACFAHRVHREEGNVLYGSCYADRLSFQPFVEALRHFAGAHDLARMLPEVAEQLWRCLPALRHFLRGAEPSVDAPGAEDRYALFEAVTEVLRHAADARPLMLVIDDVHWADAATFDLILHSVRSLPPSDCVFLLTSREAADPRADGSDDPTESFEARLGALRREAEIEHVCLEGLDEPETAKLIEVRSGAVRSDVFTRGLWRRTGGNPLFIEEMLPLVEHEQEPDLSRLEVPEPIEQVITKRLEHLRDGPRKVLARASVIGPEFTLALLEAVLGSEDEQLARRALAEIEELIRYGLLVEVPDRPDRFAFSHALIRETQYRSLIASRRARLHLQVAIALERLRGTDRFPSADLANHYWEARAVAEPRQAAEYSMQAAKDAERSAGYEQADLHYVRALKLFRRAGSNGGTRCDLRISQGKARLRAGRLQEARKSFRKAAAIARLAGKGEKLAYAALGFHGRYLSAGEVNWKAISLLEEALGMLEPRDSALRAGLLARLADSLMWEDPTRQLELSSEALRMARKVRHPVAMLEALAARHSALLHTEDLPERLGLGRERLALAKKTKKEEAVAAALRWCIHDSCEAGDMNAAKKEYVELGNLAERLRQPLFLSYARHWECVFAQLHGRLEEAERSADAAYELATGVSAKDAEMSRVDKRSAIYREQGRLKAMQPAIERCAIENPKIPAWWALLALVEAESGKPHKARAHVDRLVADDAAALPRDVFWLYGLALLAETCALLPNASEPASVVQRLLEDYRDRYVQVGMDTFPGSVWRFFGLAATAAEDWSAAEEAYREAEGRHDELGSAPLRARTRMNHAEMLIRRGDDTGEAVELLASARGLAEKHGLVDVRTRLESLQARASANATPV